MPEEEETDQTMLKQKESLSVKYLRVAGVVALYWSVSISMVFVNKYLLKSDLKLNAPLFITWFQCAVTVALCYVCSYAANRMPGSLTFPNIEFDKKLSREALPLSFVFVSMITFNNLCLLEVGIAFYTIARSLVTIFSLIFTYLILGKKTSIPALICCAVIVSGFVLGVNQEGGSLGGLSVKGVIYGIIASSMVALNAIYIKKVLPAMDDDIWKLTYFNNVNASLMFLPLILLFEIGELLSFERMWDWWFWSCMAVASFFGFIMGFVVGLEIKVTTPVTHTVSGVAKACLQTVIAVVWFQEVKTVLWWMSNILVLTGTGSYSIVKSIDMKKKHDRLDAKNSDGKSVQENSEEKSLLGPDQC